MICDVGASHSTVRVICSEGDMLKALSERMEKPELDHATLGLQGK